MSAARAPVGTPARPLRTLTVIDAAAGSTQPCGRSDHIVRFDNWGPRPCAASVTFVGPSIASFDPTNERSRREPVRAQRQPIVRSRELQQIIGSIGKGAGWWKTSGRLRSSLGRPLVTRRESRSVADRRPVAGGTPSGTEARAADQAEGVGALVVLAQVEPGNLVLLVDP